LSKKKQHRRTMDITNKWTSLVQIYQQECGRGTGKTKTNTKPTRSQNNTAESDHFLKACLEVYQNIREVEKFLEETKAKYLDVTQHLSSETETQVTSSTFNENQRAEIEREVMLWISQLTRLQQQLTTTLGEMMAHAGVSVEGHRLATEWGEDEVQAKDVWTHRVGVIAHLQQATRRVIEHFTRLRQQRLAMLLQHHTFALGSYGELPMSPSLRRVSNKSPPKRRSSEVGADLLQHNDKSEIFSSSQTQALPTSAGSSSSPSLSSSLLPSSSTSHTGKDAGVDLQLESELQQQLLRENVLLQHQLDTLVDQIRDVEREVVAISHAQQILSENVAKQQEDVANLSQAVHKAHAHVRRGNEQLQKATKEGVHFRFYVLLFLLFLSFALLLMHAYN
jgi:hypothetical protein